MSIFSNADPDDFAGIHIQRAWFGRVELPSGTRHLHTGLGPKIIDDVEWEGVSDPFGGQLVGVGQVEEPEFGQAPSVDIVLSGANRQFLKSMWDDRHAIEGAPADLHFATFDAETGEEKSGLDLLFPGKLTAPKFTISGSSIRSIALKVVSPFEGMNFPETKYMWSPAGQRERFPADEGLDLVNADIVEEFKS